MTETKKCTKCGRILSIDNFSKCREGLQCYCKECKSKYNQTYSQTHNQYYNQYRKQYKEQFTGYYLYIILDKQDNVAYIGETTNYYNRLTNHLSGGVNATKELFTNNEWACLKYLDVTDIVENDLELKALENELIELYQPICNTKLNIIHNIDRGRLFGLLAQLHNALNEWIVFKTNL